MELFVKELGEVLKKHKAQLLCVEVPIEEVYDEEKQIVAATFTNEKGEPKLAIFKSGWGGEEETEKES